MLIMANEAKQDVCEPTKNGAAQCSHLLDNAVCGWPCMLPVDPIFHIVPPEVHREKGLFFGASLPDGVHRGRNYGWVKCQRLEYLRVEGRWVEVDLHLSKKVGEKGREEGPSTSPRDVSITFCS
jgi:hypothetical protein